MSVLSLARAANRLGLAPRPSETPDHRLVEVVEGPDRIAPGRALDLGTGAGRNALYLAANGWDTTGVELDAHQLDKARRRSSAVRWVHGDVTRLSELDIGTGYTLLMDGGCYQDAQGDGRGEVEDAEGGPGVEEWGGAAAGQVAGHQGGGRGDGDITEAGGEGEAGREQLWSSAPRHCAGGRRRLCLTIFDVRGQGQ